MRRIALTLLGILFVVALASYVAGEVIETVIVRTRDAAGVTYDSKVWVADVDGTPWVRVGRAGRAWGERLRSDPHVELVRAGVTTPRLAVIDTSEPMRARVDAAFAAKYGVVDWWYGVLVRKDPIPVRLDPAPPS
ncbi:MAG TPA: hypothetical protein VL049_29780 [Candidatus Dormibacteraeota bacterium]|nr:hypothetical protein [Candidatus Dormibacteraeota bacterium]